MLGRDVVRIRRIADRVVEVILRDLAAEHDFAHILFRRRLVVDKGLGRFDEAAHEFFRHRAAFFVELFRHHHGPHRLADRRVVRFQDFRTKTFVDRLRRLRFRLHHGVDILAHQRLVQVGVGQEHQLHILALGVGVRQTRLRQLGQQQHFLDAAARHAHTLALQILDAGNLLPGAPHQPRAALGKAGHDINGRAAGTAGNGRFGRRRTHVQLAGDNRLHHIEALGEDMLFDLDAALGRDFLDVRHGAVVGELQITQAHDFLCLGLHGAHAERQHEGGGDTGLQG